MTKIKACPSDDVSDPTPDLSQGADRQSRLNSNCSEPSRRTCMTALRDYNAAVDFVDRNVAEGRGDKTACIDPARNITYGELRDAAARIGPMLARMGIERENRISLVPLDTGDFP